MPLSVSISYLLLKWSPCPINFSSEPQTLPVFLALLCHVSYTCWPINICHAFIPVGYLLPGWFLHSPSAPRSSCSLNCFYEPNFMYINLGAHLSRSMINHRPSVGRPPHFHLVSLVLQVVVRPNDSQEVERGTTHKKYTHPVLQCTRRRKIICQAPCTRIHQQWCGWVENNL